MKRRAMLTGIAALPLLGMAPRKRRSGGSNAASLDAIIGNALDPRVVFSRASGATYFDASGTLQTAASNAPRFDYGPTPGAQSLGMMIEGGNTNFVRNARVEGATVGTIGSGGVMPTFMSSSNSSGAAIVVGPTSSEQGLPCIDIQMVGTSTGGAVNINFESSLAVTANFAYAASLFLRLIAGTLTNVTNLKLFANDDVAGQSQTIANPTGAALATQRQSWVHTTSVGATVITAYTLQINLAAGAVDATYRIAVPQIEKCIGANAASSPILPAIGTPAATTRAQETCTVPVGSWFNPSAMSLAIEATPIYQPNGVTNWVSLDDTTLNNRCQIRHNNTADFVITAATVNTLNVGTFLALTNGVAFKSALSSGGGIAKSCHNGGVVTSYSGIVLPSVVTQLAIGTGNFGPTDAYIRRARAWPRILSNAEMQQVTT